MCHFIQLQAKTYAFVLRSLDSVFQFFLLTWDTKQNERSRNVVELEHYTAIVSGLELKSVFPIEKF